MIKRSTFIVPGHDDIYAECQHTPKGNHGIQSDEALHAVATELRDGRRAALVLTLATGNFPPTIPDRHWTGSLRYKQVRAYDLSLHVQPLAGLTGLRASCEFLGGCTCSPMYTSALGGDELLEGAGFGHRHRGGYNLDAAAPPEEMWKALENKLAALIADKRQLPTASDLSIDDMLNAINARVGGAASLTLDHQDGKARWKVHASHIVFWGDTLLEAVSAAYESLVYDAH